VRGDLKRRERLPRDDILVHTPRVITHKVHAVDTRFLALCMREPQVFRDWTIEGIDPKPAIWQRSLDEGAELDAWMPAIVALAKRVFPDETEAWDALDGKPAPEFPVIPLPPGYGFEPFVVRRLAGLLDVLPTWDIKRAYDADFLTANGVYPRGWHQLDARPLVEQALDKLCRKLLQVAKHGEAAMIEVIL
jgi:hypothetical protein